MLRRAARARSAPAKGRMGSATPYPAFRARSLPPPQSPQTSFPKSNRYPACKRSLKAAGVHTPAVCSAAIGRAVCAGLIRRWGRARSRRGRRPRHSAEALSALILLNPPARRPRQACSHSTQRPGTAYVFRRTPHSVPGRSGASRIAHGTCSIDSCSRRQSTPTLRAGTRNFPHKRHLDCPIVLANKSPFGYLYQRSGGGGRRHAKLGCLHGYSVINQLESADAFL